MEYQELIDQAEEALRAGGLGPVSARLDQLKLMDIPDRFRLRLANICRRAQKVERGIRILKPLYESSQAMDVLAEYCLCLTDMGFNHLALKLLEDVDSTENPGVLFQKMQCQVMAWDYQGALKTLRTYVENERLEPYQKVVGRLNLISCLVVEERLDEALEEIESVEKESIDNEWDRIQANCHELRAQVQIQQGYYQEAMDQLVAATDLIRSRKLRDSIFIRKWKAIAQSYLNDSIDEIQTFRQEAAELGHWETLRSLDFHKLKIRYDNALFDQIYFGTAHEAFRRSLLENFGNPGAIYFYPQARADIYDVETGVLNGKELFTSAHSTYSILRLLSADTYKPLKIGEIFASLFPDEHFDPDYSINKIHQLMSRTRKWLEQEQVPIGIEENQGQYSLSLTDQVCIQRFRDETHFPGGFEPQWIQLYRFFKDQPFSASDARERLGKGASMMSRILSGGIEQGHLTKEGQGSRVTYHF